MRRDGEETGGRIVRGRTVVLRSKRGAWPDHWGFADLSKFFEFYS